MCFEKSPLTVKHINKTLEKWTKENAQNDTTIEKNGIGYLQECVLRPYDDHFPLVDVVIVDEACRKALHRILVEFYESDQESGIEQ